MRLGTQRPPIQQFSAALLVSVAGFLCATGDIQARSLNENSPFLPPSHSELITKPEKPESLTPPDPDRFSLRGISKIGASYLFSIYDKKTDTSRWVPAGKVENGFCIVSYDPEMKELTYEWNRHRGQLKLNMADPLPLGVIRSITEAANNLESNAGAHSATSSTQNRTLPASRERSGKTDSRNRDSQLVYFNKILSQPQAYQNGNAYISDGPTFASVIDNSGTSGEVGGMKYIPKHLRGSFGAVRGRNNVNNPDGKPPEHLN